MNNSNKQPLGVVDGMERAMGTVAQTAGAFVPIAHEAQFDAMAAKETLPASNADCIPASPVLLTPNQTTSGRSAARIAAFMDGLLPLKRAQAAFGFTRTSFWRFRIKHRIRLLPGRQINIDDVIAGLQAERRGQRRAA
jgi:hypothetical protein